jgi:hypothetical protein
MNSKSSCGNANVALIALGCKLVKGATSFKSFHLGVFNLKPGSYSWLPEAFTTSEDILNWEY